MTRSPLAYPLNRAADTDVGGAADLQTDVMRFMAILALCLVAIFALVQSIPLQPVEPQPLEGGPSGPEPVAAEAAPTRATSAPASPTSAAITPTSAAAPVKPIGETVELTRPKPLRKPAAPPLTRGHAAVAASSAAVPAAAPAPAGDEGFTLRFASDAALMRSVAAHNVGVYAIDDGRARRMTVSESRISFWDASTPNAFHEMEADTVPVAAADALARSGAASAAVRWGVTLPGRMTAQLEALMREHRSGHLVIGAGGNISWEASP